jgi:hypothetical protein
MIEALSPEESALIEKEFKVLEYQFIRRFKKKPALEAILLIVGYQESPLVKNSQNKEEKMDLINLGLMAVLCEMGLFHRTGTREGWPTFEPLGTPSPGDRESLIRRAIVLYFRRSGLLAEWQK